MNRCSYQNINSLYCILIKHSMFNQYASLAIALSLYSSKSLDFVISKTINFMVIDHPYGLHYRVNNSRPNKIHPAIFQVFVYGL